MTKGRIHEDLTDDTAGNSTAPAKRERQGHCGDLTGEPLYLSVPVDHSASSSPSSSEPPEHFKLHYHIHGDPAAKDKIILVQGLTAPLGWWELQVEYFKNLGACQLCVFDNRGVGFSDTPAGKYTTDMMARDTLCLLDHLGWSRNDETGQRLHIAGLSMGGMITQKILLVAPQRFNTAGLLATHAGRGIKATIPPLMFFVSYVGLAMSSGGRKIMNHILDMNIGQTHLSASHASGVTNREYMISDWLRREKQTRRQPGRGAKAQFNAVHTHKLSDSDFESLRTCGVKLLVVTGTGDRVIRASNSLELAERTGATLHLWDGAGHVLSDEVADSLNLILARHMGLQPAGLTASDLAPVRSSI